MEQTGQPQDQPDPAPAARQATPAASQTKSALGPPPLAEDPSLAAAYPLRNRIARQLWAIVYVLLYRPSPRPMHAWRQFLLQLFGAKMGPKCHFYAKGKVWAPWNLICEDRVSLADDAEIYNPSPIFFGSHAIVSQGAYICGATHNYNDPKFALVSYPMRFEAYSWICARAIVAPGINAGEGAILGLGAIATRHMEPYGIYAGVPARKVKERLRSSVPWV
jgi:putative colanic acid biosynthesis acetyltransferase WcaF